MISEVMVHQLINISRDVVHTIFKKADLICNKIITT